ncbi:MAG: methyltransferase domain-containing protein [Streptosporangiales bacterium]|nr:methyltransferase domain-containing protein [Streptosporangiales bacterium]
MDPEGFRALLDPAGQRLLAALADDDGTLGDPVRDPLRAASRLRRGYPAPLVAAALTQARLRARAREKFDADADRMYFTPDGLEQATRRTVADHRARRFAARGRLEGGRLVELCCGIGGDLIALARAGYRVDALDSDPLTVEVARANVAALGLGDRVSVRRADAEEVDAGAYDAAFCDPGRRATGSRTFDPYGYAPPLPVALGLVGRARVGCVKVAPGIPHTFVPAGAEAEWVSDGGDVKEAALWLGDPAGVPVGGRPGGVARRATLLPSGATLAADPDVGDPPVRGPQRFLYEPDGAVIRAHLVAEAAALVDGALLDRTIAYITADRLVPTPFAAAYEVTDVFPFSLKRLRALLRARGVGNLTIKKRGSAVDVERLRRDLRPSGEGSSVVVLTRLAGSPTVLLCQPAGHGVPPR